MSKFTQWNSYSVFNILFLINICCIIGQAQTPSNLDSVLQDVNFRNIGPAGMSGRVTAIDVDLNNPERIFIGAASGGVWMSKDGGTSWRPKFDKMDIQSIGALKIDPSNSDVIYVGTGEGNPRNSHSSGNGMYKSWDGGETWKHIGLSGTKLIHRILVNPQDPEVVYVGALGSAWGANPERGLFRSTNGGDTWENILFINDSTGIADMVMDPTNPNKIIAATWQFARTPWTFHSGGTGSGLHITWDGGATWTKISSKDGLPKGNLGRIGIAIAASKPNIIYALVESKNNGLYKSIDGGKKWKLVSTKNIGNRPFYYAEFYVDPKNENRLFNLHTYMTMSEDGGKTFRNVLDYRTGVHPDHHAFWIHPDDPSFMIDGNDGGIAISRDGGANWRYVDNLPIGQFYHVSIDEQVPFNVYGGMQDNGSWYGPSAVYKRGGIRNQDWREMYFGDGFDVVPLGDGTRYMYAMSQGGNVGLIDKITGKSDFVKPVHLDTTRLRFNWNAAIAKDPFDENGLYFGSQFVHHSVDRGRSWTILSGDLTTNDATKQRQNKSGGLTIDATAAENHTTILCIAPDPQDKMHLLAGTDDGHLQRTIDGGKTWNEISSRLPGFPPGGWIPQIRFSTINKNEVFLVANDYRRNNWSAYAYRSTNRGDTWQRIVHDADVKGHCHAIMQDHVQENLLFLGTEQGLYYSIDHGMKWGKWTQKFPSVPVRDMQISEKEGSLILGTFGRAFWVMDDLSPLRFIAKGNLTDPVLIQNQAAYQVHVKAADGIRFTADGEYEGANRGTGLFYHVYIPTEDKKEITTTTPEKVKKKKKKGTEQETMPEEDETMAEADTSDTEKTASKKIHVLIKNLSGDTLYERKLKYHSGINTYRWSMRRQGLSGPSRSKRKKEDLPVRWSVAPGEYQLIVDRGDFRDSTTVTVLPDPRVGAEEYDYTSMKAYQDRFDALQDRLGDATDQLVAYQGELLVTKTLIKNMPDTTKKEWNKKIKTLTNQIDSLFLPLLGPRKVKGIDAVTPKLVNEVWGASAYINGASDSGNGNLDVSLAKVIKKTNIWLVKVNEFSKDKWETFKEEFQNLEIETFKSSEQIELIDD